VSELDSLVDDQALAALLSAASSLSAGAAIAVADGGGRVLAGTPSPDPRSLPIRLDDQQVGHVLYDAAMPEELAVLVCTSVELAVAGARRHASRVSAAQELAIGRDIQRSLLPARFPDAPGWRFAADYEPAREVGGDLYDVFRLRGDREDVALLIADVTGKGVPAALLMADTKALLHAAADNADDPADALARVNRILCVERRSTLFVTAALAAVDADTGSIRLATAGHEPPLVIRVDGRVETMEASGPLLGAFAAASFQVEEHQVAPGETLVLYTDGVTDTRDPTGAFYGEARLVALLATLSGASADDVRRAVLDDVRAFRGPANVYDDLTLLVAQRDP
jgi:serine phosphatase RsbU (regulator of sigma subunit)